MSSPLASLPPRLEELLADRALFGLDPHEHTELQIGLGALGRDDPTDFDRAAAAVDLAASPPDQEPLPAELSARITKQALAQLDGVQPFRAPLHTEQPPDEPQLLRQRVHTEIITSQQQDALDQSSPVAFGSGGAAAPGFATPAAAAVPGLAPPAAASAPGLAAPAAAAPIIDTLDLAAPETVAPGTLPMGAAPPGAQIPGTTLPGKTAPDSASNVVPLSPPRARRLPWLAAAVCFALAAGSFAWSSTRPQPLALSYFGGAPEVPEITAVAPSQQARRDAFIKSRKATPIDWVTGEDEAGQGASGDVAWSNEAQTGYMRFRGLAQNDPKKSQYQLWIFDRTQDERYPVDGGVFDIDQANGDVIVAINAKLPVKNPTLFLITIEKPGGVVVSRRDRVVLTASTS